MNMFLRKLAGFVLVSLFGCGFSSAQTAATPPIHVSDSWVYEDSNARTKRMSLLFLTTTAVNEKGAEVKRRTMDGRQVATLTFNKAGAQIAEDGYVNGIVKIPTTLAVGQTVTGPWSTKTGFSGKWKSTVAAQESVTVPAGTFQAWRIEYESSGDGGFSAKQTLWFVPEVKQYVKQSTVLWPAGDRYLQELVAFRVVGADTKILSATAPSIDQNQLAFMNAPVQ